RARPPRRSLASCARLLTFLTSAPATAPGASSMEDARTSESLPHATRFDPAHRPGDEPGNSPTLAASALLVKAAAAASDVREAAEAAAVNDARSRSASTPQVRRQARQLAAHLRNKQRELDQREAALHTGMAKLED